jgi:hypothetical protein
MGRFLALAVLAMVPASAAFDTQLTSSDMRRALDVARASDTERARFHASYIFKLSGAQLDYVEVQQVEVITELRRLELIGEEHARVNDMFGRGSLREAEQALLPWRDRIAIVARVRFLPTTRVLAGVPPVIVTVADSPSLPLDTRRNPVYSGGAEGSSFLVGATVEALYDAAAVGSASRPVSVLLDAREIARVTIDFGALK